MKGLLIEFDASTGRRAGNINPRDSQLLCHGWQNLDVVPAIEIRVIRDNRDTKQYEGVKGVTVLNTDVEIEDAIATKIPSKYNCKDETLMRLDIEQQGIKVKDIPSDDLNEIYKHLKSKGIKGIVETKPLKLADVYRVESKEKQ